MILLFGKDFVAELWGKYNNVFFAAEGEEIYDF